MRSPPAKPGALTDISSPSSCHVRPPTYTTRSALRAASSAAVSSKLGLVHCSFCRRPSPSAPPRSRSCTPCRPRVRWGLRRRPGDVPQVRDEVPVDTDAITLAALQAQVMRAAFKGAQVAAPARRRLAVVRVRPAPFERGRGVASTADRRTRQVEVVEPLRLHARVGAVRVQAHRIRRHVLQRRGDPARAFHERDLRLPEAGADAGQHGDGLRRLAAVVADQRVDAVGVRADHGDAARRRASTAACRRSSAARATGAPLPGSGAGRPGVVSLGGCRQRAARAGRACPRRMRASSRRSKARSTSASASSPCRDRAHRGGGVGRRAAAELAHHVGARLDGRRHGPLRRVDVAVCALRWMSSTAPQSDTT